MRDPAKRLEAHRRYNASLKGRARNKRYEDKHPERAQRIRTGFIAQDAARIARRDDA